MKKFRLYKSSSNSMDYGKKEATTDINSKKASKRFYSPHFDVLGSYTGSGLDPMDIPEQDSDDL